MKAYHYIVITKEKVKKQGLLWADSEDEIKTKLKLEGYTICNITVSEEKQTTWTYKAISDVSQQLGLLLSSGIPLRRALTLMDEQNSNPAYRFLYEGIQRGQSLSQTFYQLGFPVIAVALLEAGEAAGTLGETLQYIANYYEHERQWKQKIISAISYPSFLLLLMNVFFLVTLLFIIPSFSHVFATMHVELPWMTRGLFVLGQSLREHPFIYIGVHILIVICTVIGVNNQRIQMSIHKRLWKLAHRNTPLTALYYTNVLAVWALLLDSGISIIPMMKMTKEVWRNRYGRICSERVVTMLEAGHSFGHSIEACSIGNLFIWQMVAVGEESGELVAMLRHCSKYYDSLLNQYITRLERLMEPILLSIMGIGIAILVVSVMYPLFTSISSLSY
ncbi:MAG: type II secretion system F family protein [Veillonella caviae]|uniref:type II secretion system F family protein n=1 Tax=Veillonella caviae TaxID=248316 RepID=UPI002A91D8EB|nr:type II secretion system F family protein [Veillonella caviae]MDY5482421.1 type II secretion system F family protein [Veillonella caviae]